MQWIGLFIIIAATFGVCWFFDKGFSRLFRHHERHRSGLSVRLNKRYASFGLLLCVVGIGAFIVGLRESWLLAGGGVLVLLAGAALVVYWMTFGIYYDDEGFLLESFGKKSGSYTYRDIAGQKLYAVQGGQMLVELHMADGRTVSFQSSMEGTYPFLDHAFAAWCRQTGRDPKDCGFHVPAEGQWFPKVEDV